MAAETFGRLALTGSRVPGLFRCNVRVVCLAANFATNEWGFDPLLRRGVVRTSNVVSKEAEKLAQFDAIAPTPS